MRHFAGRRFSDALRHGEDGQALVEYALIIALVAVVAITGLTAIQVSLNNMLQFIITTLTG